MTTIDPNAVYTAQQALPLTGVSYQRFFAALHTGKLPSTRTKRLAFQIKGSDLIAWLSQVEEPRAWLEPMPQLIPGEPEPFPSNEIHALRQRLGWSQIKLARRLGCAQTAVANWETGRHAPGPNMRRAIRELMAEVKGREDEG